MIGLRLDVATQNSVPDLRERLEKFLSMLVTEPSINRLIDLASIPGSVIGYDTLRSACKIVAENATDIGDRVTSLRVFVAALGRSRDAVHEREVVDAARWMVTAGLACQGNDGIYANTLFNLAVQLAPPQPAPEPRRGSQPARCPGRAACRGTVSTSAYIRERVLRAVGGTGLHQDVPGSSASSARFTNLGGAVDVEWCIGWDDKGLRHVVTVGGKSIPRSLGRCIGWDKKIAVHEAHVYRILCYLLRDLEPHA